MDKALYIGMSGASQTMRAQTVHAHNLANATTTGFRADLAMARALPLYGDALGTRIYSAMETNGSDFSSGPIQPTGNDLDIAVQGEGWITVLASDGTEAYTRAGDLHVSQFGELINGKGLPVMGNNGPVSLPPLEKLEIGSDGTISVRELGQGSEVMAVLDRIKLVNPAQQDLVKGADGLFRRRDGAAEIADGNVQVVAGFLEGSNVNIVDAMVGMINLTRSYELNVKLMQTAEQNSEASARLLQIQ